MANDDDELYDRRKFLKQCLIGGCGLAWAGYTAGKMTTFHTNHTNNNSSYQKKLPDFAREASWYKVSGDRIHCELCPHQCKLEENGRGRCRTRIARGRKLYTLAYGNPCSVHLDPIEKKPFNHFLPATTALSIATGGCNLRCLNCQNWEISQTNPDETEFMTLPPAEVVKAAVSAQASSIAYTYSEPIVFYEYTRDTAAIAKEQGIRSLLVTAGYILPEPLSALTSVIAAANVDIKAFDNSVYRKLCQATLEPVLKGIELLLAKNVWVEITYLIVPSYTDDLNQIKEMCRWIVSNLGPDVPLHFSRFYPAYKLTALPLTPINVLINAREAALEKGLRYVYIGNVPGLTSAQNTICPGCGRPVIERSGFRVVANRLKDGLCSCGYQIAGRWS